MYCSHCGKLIPEEANVEYCPACGSRIATAQTVGGKPARNETGIGVTAKGNPKINIHKVLNIGWIALSVILFLCLAAPFVKGSYLTDEMTGYDVVASISDDEDAKNEQAAAVLIIAMMVYGVIGIIYALVSFNKKNSDRISACVTYIIEGSVLSIMILVCRKFMANALRGYTQLIGEGVSYTTAICFIMCAFAVICLILSYSNGEIKRGKETEIPSDNGNSLWAEKKATLEEYRKNLARLKTIIDEYSNNQGEFLDSKLSASVSDDTVYTVHDEYPKIKKILYCQTDYILKIDKMIESEFPEYADEDEPSIKGEEDAEYYEGNVLTKDKEDSKDESFK